MAALEAALLAATAAEAATTALAETKQTKNSEFELTRKLEEDRRAWQDWKFAEDVPVVFRGLGTPER